MLWCTFLSNLGPNYRDEDGTKEVVVTGDVEEETHRKPIKNGPIKDETDPKDDDTIREPVYIVHDNDSTQNDEAPPISSLNVGYVIVGVVVGIIILVALAVLSIKLRKNPETEMREIPGICIVK